MHGPVHVSQSYLQYPKQAVPRGLLRPADGMLKLYHLERPGAPVPEEIGASARAALAGPVAEAAGLAGDCGFAILHRCGADFYFLLVVVWRASNEAWEAVWHRDGGMDAFAPFAPAYPAEPGALRPTFCVWELGIVAHESAAWTGYLASSRGATDLARWQEDVFEGEV